MNVDKNILYKLINKWFDTVKNDEINEELLFLDDMDDVLEKKLASNVSLKKKYQILDVDSYLENNTWMYGPKNIILYSRKEALKNDFSGKYIKEKILFVGKGCFSNSMMEELLSENKNNSTDIVNKSGYQYYVEKLEPLNIIDDINLEYFIKDRIRYIKSIYCYRNFLSLLLESIDYEEENYLHIIDEDTIFFNSNRILRSRLAVLIYRISTLKLNASITEAGRYFSRELGIKSKTYSVTLLKKFNKIKKITINSSSSINNFNKNFKAYDLNSNEAEIAIKKEIAKKLLNYKKCNFDIETIAKLTNLPINEMYRL